MGSKRNGWPWKDVFPAVLWESGLMGTRRKRFCTPGGTAPSPFAELVWHPGPALEWAQNWEWCWGYQKVPNPKAALGAFNIFCFKPLLPPAAPPAPCSSTPGPYQGSTSDIPVWIPPAVFWPQALCIVYHRQVQPKKLPALHCCWNRGAVVTNTWEQCAALWETKLKLTWHLWMPQPLQSPKQWLFAASPLQDERDELWCCSSPAPSWRKENHRALQILHLLSVWRHPDSLGFPRRALGWGSSSSDKYISQ